MADVLPFFTGAKDKEEVKILKDMTKEEHARRLATEKRKEAERVRVEAAAAKQAHEDRARKRQEEALQFQQQQRLWWDEEVMHQMTVSKDAYFKEEEQQRQDELMHVMEVAETHKQIDKIEMMKRLRQEQEVAARELAERKAREADALQYRDAKVAQRAEEVRQQRHQDSEIKARMAAQAALLASQQEKLRQQKFAQGEKERRTVESKRQSKESEAVKAAAADYDLKSSQFKNDEAARAQWKSDRASKQKLRRKQGNDRMKQLDEERKAAERAEKQRQAEAYAPRSLARPSASCLRLRLRHLPTAAGTRAHRVRACIMIAACLVRLRTLCRRCPTACASRKKEFQSKMRKKAAEDEVIKEREKHMREAWEAENALADAQRDMKLVDDAIGREKVPRPPLRARARQ